MANSILDELNIQALRVKFLKFTRNAYQLLPKVMNPKILDIGCGTGQSTMELAKLSEELVVGIDIDKNALDKLNSEIEKKNLLKLIKTIHCSIYEIDFPNQCFNVIWDEGVIHLLELNKVLKIFYRILKEEGYLVMFETIFWMKDKFEIFAKYGFNLINHFLLPEAYWWTEYYLPLESMIKELYIKYKNSKQLQDLKSYESEIAMVKKNPRNFDCGFYIMQKSKLRDIN